jgi:hypothetical protein
LASGSSFSVILSFLRGKMKKIGKIGLTRSSRSRCRRVLHQANRQPVDLRVRPDRPHEKSRRPRRMCF